MRTSLGVIILVGLVVLGCSDNKSVNQGTPAPNTSTTTWIADGGYWQSVIDATSSTNFRYFSFAVRDTISVADSQAAHNLEWDIAFRRTIIETNGGISGNKGVTAVDLAGIGFPHSLNFDSVVSAAGVDEDDWVQDYYDLAVDNWYTYDQTSHTIQPTLYVYMLKDAEGCYVKFQVTALYGGGQPPDMGNVVFRYVYAAQGTDLSSPVVTDTLEIGSDTAYYDFSAGQETTPTDPGSSVAWDLALAAYEIHLNSNLFGPGIAAAYLVRDSYGQPRTDFENITQAETQPQAYSRDEAGSAFTNWFDYNSTTHQITSKGHVYLVKVDSNIYKVQLQSYYRNINGQPVSGWYTFRWLKLQP